MTTPLPLLAVLALAGCVAATPLPSGPLTGEWGAAHAGLVLDASGGRLEYDCAAGTIDEPVDPDTGGRFAADGSHTPGTGGPTRVGETSPSYPARYTGTVRGDTLRLTVEMPARQLVLGPFDMARGAQPMLTRCL